MEKQVVILNDAEKKAINEKLDNPTKIIQCPRCGANIIYEVRGNSIAVECETKGCIYGGLRGV